MVCVESSESKRGDLVVNLGKGEFCEKSGQKGKYERSEFGGWRSRIGNG